MTGVDETQTKVAQATMVIMGALALTALFAGCGDDDKGGSDAGKDAGTSVDCATEADGTPCGNSLICRGGSCVDLRCGDGVVSGTEECDDQNSADGDGCQNDCTFTCELSSDCDDLDACNGEETCEAATHRCKEGTSRDEGDACTLRITEVAADGGVADGGTDGGAADAGIPTMGLCVANRCGEPCDSDGQCDDADACNGDETCDPTLKHCRPGARLDCDDDERCTTDSCDAALGCVNDVLSDGDGDGFAAQGVTCDNMAKYGGDCNDGDDEIYPGAPELCDVKNNDCDAKTDEEAPTWYQDCDEDGYARAAATTKQTCDPPAPEGGCGGWTLTIPVGGTQTDCDDSNAAVHPDVTEFQDRPYCEDYNAIATGTYPGFTCSSGGAQDWDYDCNAQEQQRYTTYNSSGCTYHPGICSGGRFCLKSFCSGSGWTTPSRPSCGQTAPYRSCRLITIWGPVCISSVADRKQECR